MAADFTPRPPVIEFVNFSGVLLLKDDLEAAQRDYDTYGTVWILDGRRIPPEDWRQPDPPEEPEDAPRD